jgi:hypothetical protein
VLSNVVTECLCAGEYPRILSEPDPGVEIPGADAGRKTDGTLVPRTLPGRQSRRGGDRHGRRRRNTALLECLQQSPISKGKTITSFVNAFK